MYLLHILSAICDFTYLYLFVNCFWNLSTAICCYICLIFALWAPLKWSKMAHNPFLIPQRWHKYAERERFLWRSPLLTFLPSFVSGFSLCNLWIIRECCTRFSNTPLTLELLCILTSILYSRIPKVLFWPPIFCSHTLPLLSDLFPSFLPIGCLSLYLSYDCLMYHFRVCPISRSKLAGTVKSSSVSPLRTCCIKNGLPLFKLNHCSVLNIN